MSENQTTEAAKAAIQCGKTTAMVAQVTPVTVHVCDADQVEAVTERLRPVASSRCFLPTYHP